MMSVSMALKSENRMRKNKSYVFFFSFGCKGLGKENTTFKVHVDLAEFTKQTSIRRKR